MTDDETDVPLTLVQRLALAQWLLAAQGAEVTELRRLAWKGWERTLALEQERDAALAAPDLSRLVDAVSMAAVLHKMQFKEWWLEVEEIARLEIERDGLIDATMERDAEIEALRRLAWDSAVIAQRGGIWEAQVADLAAKVGVLEQMLSETHEAKMATCRAEAMALVFSHIERLEREIYELRRLAWDGWAEAVFWRHAACMGRGDWRLHESPDGGLEYW